MVTAHELVLSRRPQGRIEPGCFTLVERKLPALSQGQLLVRADCFSVDPSMIPRLSVDTYAAAFDLGAAVEARAVGRVVQSRADGWSEGDWALCWGGWRDYAVVDASAGIRIQPRSGLPPHTWLHVLGVPGLTAYIGLVDVARMQPGDRVLGIGRSRCRRLGGGPAGEGPRCLAGDRIPPGAPRRRGTSPTRSGWTPP